MSEYSTGYQAFEAYRGDEEREVPPTVNIVHVNPDKHKARWTHIEDLDEFFARVYEYHQRSGLLCMLVQDILQLLQFLFIILFSTFMIECVDYQTLFYERQYNHTHKVTIPEAVYPINQCLHRFDFTISVCLIVALLFWLLRLIKVVFNVFKYTEMKNFYTSALKISSAELGNVTWHDVQLRLLEVQQELEMCVHKRDLTQLDIYHRILRFKNYTIAMVNKSLLPLNFTIPAMGEHTYLTQGLKYNLEMILFWGPWAPFENNWHLRSEYRNYHQRQELAENLSKRVLWIGLANLFLCPLILIWTVLYSFFRYADTIKREPGFLGSRSWSLYARIFLRHFNELDHEFNARLNRAYRPAEKYMSSFTSPIVVIIAKHVAFFAGSILAAALILTVIDEDVLNVSNVITIITVCGITVSICRACIPDENQVFCPELLLRRVLSEIHYIPDNWRGQAHTPLVVNRFSLLFTYKVVSLLEEIISPIVTPWILIFRLRPKCLDIVDFYRHFTVEVTGVGDVCSFAQMDIRKHGNPKWLEENETEADQYEQAEHGKTELSLVHFTLTNPEWRPPSPEGHFIQHLKQQVQHDATTGSMLPAENPLLSSLSSAGYPGYSSMLSSMIPSAYPARTPDERCDSGPQSMLNLDITLPGPPPTLQPLNLHPQLVRGAVKNTEFPIGALANGLLASAHQAMTPGYSSMSSLGPAPSDPYQPADPHTLEHLSSEMSFSALYIHELHHRRMAQPWFENFEDLSPQSPPTHQRSTGGTSRNFFTSFQQRAPRMPNIVEDEVELENVPIRGIWQSDGATSDLHQPDTYVADLTDPLNATSVTISNMDNSENQTLDSQTETAPLLEAGEERHES